MRFPNLCSSPISSVSLLGKTQEDRLGPLMFCLLLSSEGTTRSFNWLRHNFSESIVFNFMFKILQNSFFFFSFLEKCWLSREFREKFAQIIENSVHGYRSILLVGDILYYFVLQLLKISCCLVCVTSTAMTSEAGTNPLTPVGQFSLSEYHSGQYGCGRSFIRKQANYVLPMNVPIEPRTTFDVPPRFY